MLLAVCLAPALAETHDAVRDELVITLESNPTTGYSWQYEADNQAIVSETSSTYLADQSGLAGAGGRQVFTFVGKRSGEVRLRFVYVRAWETRPPLKTAVYDVTVHDDKTLSIISSTENSE